jgi:hypothetical protein
MLQEITLVQQIITTLQKITIGGLVTEFLCPKKMSMGGKI